MPKQQLIALLKIREQEIIKEYEALKYLLEYYTNGFPNKNAMEVKSEPTENEIHTEVNETILAYEKVHSKKCKICIVCGQEFIPGSNRQMICSICKLNNRKADDKKEIILRVGERICANKECKKVFRPGKFNQKYCSVKCEAKNLNNEAIIK